MKKQLLNKILKGYEVKFILNNDYIIFNKDSVKVNEKNKEKCLNQTFFNKKIILKKYTETNNTITILFEEK